MRHNSDPLSFYTIAATAIPVLLFAMIFQARAYEFDSVERTLLGLFIGLLAVAAGVAGEATALKVLYEQHPAAWTGRAVVWSLGYLGAVFVGMSVATVAGSSLGPGRAALAVAMVAMILTWAGGYVIVSVA